MLKVISATGKTHVFSGAPGPSATIRLNDRALHYKLAFNPSLYVGEAYMDGSLTIEEGSRGGGQGGDQARSRKTRVRVNASARRSDPSRRGPSTLFRTVS